YVCEIAGGACAVQQLTPAANDAWSLDRVVRVQELLVDRSRSGKALHQPQLLEHPDVGVVPDGRAHQGVVLGGQALVVQRLQELVGAMARLLQISSDPLLEIHSRCSSC